MGEIVKYGLVFKKNILDKLSLIAESKDEDRLFKLIRTEEFENIIYRCCCIKVKVVEKDEFDYDYRNLLNFGHTIGHCIENAFNLKEMNHGKAISIGMMVAIDISISMSLVNKEMKEIVIKLYRKLKLPYKIPKVKVDKIINVMKYDKKFRTSQNKFVLLKGINKPVFYYNVDKSLVIDNIKKSMYNYI